MSVSFPGAGGSAATGVCIALPDPLPEASPRLAVFPPLRAERAAGGAERGAAVQVRSLPPILAEWARRIHFWVNIQGLGLHLG
jgi:hypothetical protein